LTNVAENSLVEYEAAPAELLKAQREMRERGEKLLAIYHSHPQQSDPTPSATDVRRAFYDEAVYLIVGFAQDETIVRGFRLFESEKRWERAVFEIVE